MATFNLRMQKFRRAIEIWGLRFYMWPHWFSYQNKRFRESYWPAYSRSKDRKNFIFCIAQLSLLTIYWGCLPYHYFRYGLYRKKFEWKEVITYIPETVVYNRILPKINSNQILLDNKNITEEILKANNLPIPETIIKIRHGELFGKNGEYISNQKELKSYLGKVTIKKIIAKPADCGSGGEKICFLDKEKIDYNQLKKDFYGDWIFQEVLENGGLLKEMNPSSLNSFRILTLFTSRGPEVLYAILKIGSNYAKTDNAHTGGIYIGIDLKTEKLMDKAFNEDLLEFTEHFNTKFKFKNQKILGFKNCSEQAKLAARFFPETKFIGWDIALTKKGPIILEGNSSPGLTIIQRTQNGMSKFYELANEIIRNK